VKDKRTKNNNLEFLIGGVTFLTPFMTHGRDSSLETANDRRNTALEKNASEGEANDEDAAGQHRSALDVLLEVSTSINVDPSSVGG